MSDERIGVIMPLYNGERYVARALRSLLRESDVQLEIVVVDDASTDRSAEVVQAIARDHPCVSLIKVDHGGVSRARNVGFAALSAEAKLVIYLDCDDLNPSNRMRRQVAIMRQHPEIDYVIGQVQFFETEDEQSLAPAPGTRSVIARSVQLGAAMFRRSLLERLGGFAEDMKYGEDVDLFLRMVEDQTPHFLDEEVAVFYRRHAGNVTNDPGRTRLGLVDAIRRSMARRRANGCVVELGEMFKARPEAESLFHHA